MLSKILKSSLPHLNILTSILLIIGIMVMSAAGAFMIRMQKGPIDLEFAKPRLEKVLSDKGYNVKINKAVLTWPNVMQPILIELRGVKILQNDVTGLSVEKLSIGLSGLNLWRGKVLPNVVIIEGPEFQLVQENGRLKLFWQEDGPEDQIVQKQIVVSEEVYGPVRPVLSPREIRRSVRDFFDVVMDPAKEGSDILAALKKVELKRAVIKGQGENSSNVDYLALVDLSLNKTRYGLQGDLDITLPAESVDKKSGLKSSVVYRKAKKDLTFTASVNDINPSRFAAYFPQYPLIIGQNIDIGGRVTAAFDDKMRLQLATLDLNVPEGNINLPDIYDVPVPMKDIILKAQLNRQEKFLNVTNFKADIGGIAITGTAEGKFEKGNMSAPVELKIASLSLENIPPIFPKSHFESSAGQWLTHKLSDGKFNNVVLNTDFIIIRDTQNDTADARMENIKLSFEAEDVTVKYSDTLMPVKNVVGRGVYEDDTLTIIGDSALIGDIQGKNVKLVMTNLSVEGGGEADISLEASGPLKTALEFVSDEPIAVGDDLGFDIKGVKGNLDYTVQLNFPTVKDLPKEEVKVVVKGVANDILLPNVVKGMSLSGGPFDLGFKDGLITLKGKGLLDQRPIDLDYQEYLDSTGRDFSSKIQAKLMADEGVRKAFGIGLEDYISGPVAVDVTYLDKGVKASVEVKGDLTPAILHIDPFDYKKAAGVAGDLFLKGFITGQDLNEIDALKLNAPEFSFSDGRIILRKLKDGSTDISRGKIGAARLGKTQVSVDFEVMPDNTLKISASGPVVDIEPFINADKADSKNEQSGISQQPMMISVNTPKMLAKNDSVLQGAKLYLETDTGGDITRIEMDSKIEKGTMFVRFKPDTAIGKRTFRLESSDAGATLKAFGLYDDMREGTMVIYGEPTGKNYTGNLIGKAELENFRVVRAPALAKLLSVMSLSGVQGLLKNEGLSFSKLESDFEWKFLEAGNLLVVKEGRTSGSSLGLTFEGLVNIGAKTTDISGTIIPVSGVNEALGNIPVLGQLLTGGDALIAATYSMKGPSDDPNVSVNPLSVLAPGFLRKIFFEGDVDAKVKREEAKSPDVKTQAGSQDNRPANDNTPQQVQQPVVTAPNINAN